MILPSRNYFEQDSQAGSADSQDSQAGSSLTQELQGEQELAGTEQDTVLGTM